MSQNLFLTVLFIEDEREYYFLYIKTENIERYKINNFSV